MGVCNSVKNCSAERTINKIFLHPSFILSRLTYDSLIQLVTSIGTEDSNVSKSSFNQNLLPLLYQETPRSRYTSYHTNLFDLIQRKLKTMANVNEVVFFLYPFILKEDKAQTSLTLYTIFKNVKPPLKLGILHELVYDYVYFSSRELTYIIWYSCDENDLIPDLDKMNSEVFTEYKVREFSNKFVEVCAKKKISKDDDEVSYEVFNYAFKKYKIDTYNSIRKMLM